MLWYKYVFTLPFSLPSSCRLRMAVHHFTSSFFQPLPLGNASISTESQVCTHRSLSHSVICHRVAFPRVRLTAGRFTRPADQLRGRAGLLTLSGKVMPVLVLGCPCRTWPDTWRKSRRPLSLYPTIWCNTHLSADSEHKLQCSASCWDICLLFQLMEHTTLLRRRKLLRDLSHFDNIPLSKQRGTL